MKVGFAQSILNDSSIALVTKIFSELSLGELKDRAETIGLVLNGAESREELVLEITRAIMQGV